MAKCALGATCRWEYTLRMADDTTKWDDAWDADLPPLTEKKLPRRKLPPALLKELQEAAAENKHKHRRSA